ncbi:hypothetical protein L210DRAFT_3528532 [Boletus edulis BED1]|uniref:Uncharacterized protein n=1 Tax=Boletus edulis BED1 TaxID=1328754 RepID=A0AAD4C2I2_BOLED|nr:hypothetical protein L210DRAFT_3528532 [Boletus edulis BED1]
MPNHENHVTSPEARNPPESGAPRPRNANMSIHQSSISSIIAAFRSPANMVGAVKRFSRALDDRPEVSFTISIITSPGTNCIIVLAKPDVENSEKMLIQIYDPRYIVERMTENPCCKSHPWKLANEQAAAMARTENSHLSDEELKQILHSHRAEELSGEDLITHNILWEEYCYRLVMGSYKLDLRVYELMKDHPGFASQHLVMAGQILSPDERAIQVPAIVTRDVPTVGVPQMIGNINMYVPPGGYSSTRS